MRDDALEPLPLTAVSRDRESSPAVIGLGAVEALHIGAVALGVFLAILAPVAHRGMEGLVVALCAGLASLAALTIARAIRRQLSDLYRQFQYREKFALFLVHLGVLFVPYILGLRDGTMLAILFITFLSLQGVNNLFFGRILFVQTLVVFFALYHAPLPPPWLVAAWLAAFLLAARIGHLRWRIQAHPDCSGIGPDGFVRRTLLAILIPPAVGWMTWELALLSGMTRRQLAFAQPVDEGPSPTPLAIPTPISLWQAAFFIAAIIASLVLLWWLDKQLRSRRQGEAMEEVIGTADARLLTPPEREDASLPVDKSAGPRQQVIDTFLGFSRHLEKMGLARGESESADQWLARLGHHAATIDDSIPLIFNKACYSTLEVTGSEAQQFMTVIEKHRGAIQARLEAERDDNRDL